MSDRYRVRAEHDHSERACNGGAFTVERKAGWFFWQYVDATDDPENFESIVKQDMEERAKRSQEAYERQSFKPIYAVAYWLAKLGKIGEAELRITIDTKG
ncbi:hypothetical protein IB276_22395 [Ensifer sp. ENS04]|uniref:hypothetical protein n=1 Tax=Ensifer sp. ENS04 TaxID=2769281 RepID=UPI0017857F5D|nr:hypothetical protein [Ensifer sp. ENS04]MBD9542198.1 hypothetical protein [Ensifer sp. ENS04]